MLVSIHSDDLDALKTVTSSIRTPALSSFLETGKTRAVSSVIEELRVIGRTAAKTPAEFARDLVPSLLKASTLELEVGE